MSTETTLGKKSMIQYLGMVMAVLWIAGICWLYTLQLTLGWLLSILIMGFLAVLASGILFLIIRKPLPALGSTDTTHEDFGSALRVQQRDAMYTRVPILGRVRRELPQALIIIPFIWILGITPLGPFCAPEIKRPDPAEYISADLCRPTLFLVNDSQCILAPAALSADTLAILDLLPEKGPLDHQMYRAILSGKYQEAVDMGGVAEVDTSHGADPRRVLLALAQAELLAGKADLAVKHYAALNEKKTAEKPVVKFQYVAALLHASKITEAIRALNDISGVENPAKSADAQSVAAANKIPTAGITGNTAEDDLRIFQLRIIAQALQGRRIPDVYAAGTAIWNARRDQYFSQLDRRGESLEKVTMFRDTLGDDPASSKKGDSVKPNEKVLDKNSPDELRKLHTAELNFLLATNDLSVLLTLHGNFSSALKMSSFLEYLSTSGTSAHSTYYILLNGCSWNTRSVTQMILGLKPAPDNSHSAETDVIPASVPQDSGLPRLFPEKRMDWHTDIPLSECFRHAKDCFLRARVQESDPIYLVQLCHGADDAFIRSAYHSAELKVNTNELLTINKAQNKRIETGYDVRTFPLWMVGMQATLCRYYHYITGSAENTRDVLDRSAKLLSTRCGSGCLPDLSIRLTYANLRMESRILYPKMWASMKETGSTITNMLVAAKNELPENHPLIMRLNLAAARYALMQKNYDDARKYHAEAERILKKIEIPDRHSWCLQCKSIQTVLSIIGNSARTDISETPEQKNARISAALKQNFSPLLKICQAQFGENSQEMINLYSDLAFIYLTEGNESRSINTMKRILKIYTAIYGEKSSYRYLKQLRDFLTDES